MYIRKDYKEFAIKYVIKECIISNESYTFINHDFYIALFIKSDLLHYYTIFLFSTLKMYILTPITYNSFINE